MPNSEVSRVELNADGTINLQLNVSGFDAGTPIEISGHVIQDNGAVAAFYSVAAMPASGSVHMTRLPAVPNINFVPGFPITVVARAAQVWITTLREDSDPAALQSNVVADPVQTAWKAENRNWAVYAPGFVQARGWDPGDTTE